MLVELMFLLNGGEETQVVETAQTNRADGALRVSRRRLIRGADLEAKRRIALETYAALEVQHVRRPPLAKEAPAAAPGVRRLPLSLARGAIGAESQTELSKLTSLAVYEQSGIEPSARLTISFSLSGTAAFGVAAITALDLPTRIETRTAVSPIAESRLFTAPGETPLLGFGLEGIAILHVKKKRKITDAEAALDFAMDLDRAGRLR